MGSSCSARMRPPGGMGWTAASRQPGRFQLSSVSPSALCAEHLQRGHSGLGIYVGDMSSTECKGPARMSTRDDPCQLSSGRCGGEIDLHPAVTSTHHVEVDSKRSSILPQDRIIGLGDANGTEPSFLGGIRLGGYNATIPLVRMSLLPAELRLQPSIRALRSLVPVWEIRYDDVGEAQAVGKIPILSAGIRLRSRSSSEWIVFWTGRRRTAVLKALIDKGVSVSATPVRFHFLHPEA